MKGRETDIDGVFRYRATPRHDGGGEGGVLRRGKPAANVVYGNSVSILVGDFLFARASQLMTEDGDLDVLGIYARTLVSLSEGGGLQLMKSADRKITGNGYRGVRFQRTR